jgi:hypothetical protein
MRRTPGQSGGIKSVVILLVTDVFALWYFIAGGRLSNTLLLLASVLSLALMPPRYSIGVLARHKWMTVSVSVLAGLAVVLDASAAFAQTASLLLAAMFALSFGAVVAYADTVLHRRFWIFNAITVLSVALAAWAVVFTVAMAPQSDLFASAAGISTFDLEQMFGIFYVGNNEYTLTYYLLVPLVAGSLIFAEGTKRRTVLLLGCALVCLALAIVIGRRSVVLTAVVTALAMAGYAAVRARTRWRMILIAVEVSVVLAGVALWLQSRGWGGEALEGFQRRSDFILEDPRQELWVQGMKAIVAQPFGGGRAVFQGSSSYAHNVILDVGLDLGVAGTLVLALMFGQIAWRALARLSNRRQPPDGLELCLIAIIFAHLFISMSEPFLPERQVVLLWAAVTLSCVSRVDRSSAA